MSGGYLSTREVARRLQISEKTLINWRVRKVGPSYYKMGGRVWYEPADVDNWIRRGRRLASGRD